MSKQDFVSNVKLVPYPQQLVYEKLADLTFFNIIKQRLADHDLDASLTEKLTAEQVADLRNRLEGIEVTRDSLTGDSPMGRVTLSIVEREEPKCIKFEVEGAPIAANLWIQLLPQEADNCRMRITARVELSFFIRKMVEGKLRDGVEILADRLATIPYGALDSAAPDASQPQQ